MATREISMSVLAIATLLVGCQTGGAGAGSPASHFELGAVSVGAAVTAPAPTLAKNSDVGSNSPATVVAAPELAVGRSAVVAAGTSGGGFGGSGGAAPSGVSMPATAGGGTLTVNVAQALAASSSQFHLLATPADVDHAEVRLSMLGLTDRVQVVSHAELVSGGTSVTFGGLADGTATITVTAFSAAGVLIGTKAQQGQVAAGQTTTVAIAVPIDPATSSGTTDVGGTLAAQISFVTATATPAACATPTPSGTILRTIFAPTNTGLFADNNGHVWNAFDPASTINDIPTSEAHNVADGTPVANAALSGRLGQPGEKPITAMAFTPASGGAFINYPVAYKTIGSKQQPVTGLNITTSMAIDATGALVCPEAGVLMRYVLGGTPTSTGIAVGSQICYDAAGHLWTNDASASTLREYAADGTLMGTFTTPYHAGRIKADPLGAVWIDDAPNFYLPSPNTATRLTRVNPDGSMGLSMAITHTDFCVLPSGRVWLACGQQTCQLAPDGTLVGQYAVPSKFVAAGNGYVFAADGTHINEMAP